MTTIRQLPKRPEEFKELENTDISKMSTEEIIARTGELKAKMKQTFVGLYKNIGKMMELNSAA